MFRAEHQAFLSSQGYRLLVTVRFPLRMAQFGAAFGAALAEGAPSTVGYFCGYADYAKPDSALVRANSWNSEPQPELPPARDWEREQ
jgi:hypothetical protein